MNQNEGQEENINSIKSVREDETSGGGGTTKASWLEKITDQPQQHVDDFIYLHYQAL